MNEIKEEFKNIHQLRTKFPFGRLGRMRLGGDMRFVYHQEGEMLFTIDQMGMSRDCFKIDFVFDEEEKAQNNQLSNIRLSILEIDNLIDVLDNFTNIEDHPHLISIYKKLEDNASIYEMSLSDRLKWWLDRQNLELFSFGEREGSFVVCCGIKDATLYRESDNDSWHPFPRKYI